MIESLNKITMPGAVVLCVGIIAATCCVVALFIAADGGKWPWEK